MTPTRVNDANDPEPRCREEAESHQANSMQFI